MTDSLYQRYASPLPRFPASPLFVSRHGVAIERGALYCFHSPFPRDFFGGGEGFFVSTGGNPVTNPGFEHLISLQYLLPARTLRRVGGILQRVSMNIIGCMICIIACGAVSARAGETFRGLEDRVLMVSTGETRFIFGAGMGSKAVAAGFLNAQAPGGGSATG